jgi:hypothetical protein
MPNRISFPIQMWLRLWFIRVVSHDVHVTWSSWYFERRFDRSPMFNGE